jgi:hypothetical protein
MARDTVAANTLPEAAVSACFPWRKGGGGVVEEKGLLELKECCSMVWRARRGCEVVIGSGWKLWTEVYQYYQEGKEITSTSHHSPCTSEQKQNKTVLYIIRDGHIPFTMRQCATHSPQWSTVMTLKISKSSRRKIPIIPTAVTESCWNCFCYS